MTFFGSAWRTKNENSAASAQTQSAPGTISVHGDSPVAGAADVTTTSVAVGVVGAGSVAAGSEVGGALARAPPAPAPAATTATINAARAPAATRELMVIVPLVNSRRSRR